MLGNVHVKTAAEQEMNRQPASLTLPGQDVAKSAKETQNWRLRAPFQLFSPRILPISPFVWLGPRFLSDRFGEEKGGRIIDSRMERSDIDTREAKCPQGTAGGRDQS